MLSGFPKAKFINIFTVRSDVLNHALNFFLAASDDVWSFEFVINSRSQMRAVELRPNEVLAPRFRARDAEKTHLATFVSPGKTLMLPTPPLWKIIIPAPPTQAASLSTAHGFTKC